MLLTSMISLVGDRGDALRFAADLLDRDGASREFAQVLGREVRRG